MTKYILLGISLFLSICNNSVCQETEINSNQLFAEFENQMSYNFDHRKYNKCINLIDSFIESEKFIQLICRHKAALYHWKGKSYYSLGDWSSALQVFKSKAIPLWKECHGHSKIKEADSYFAAAMSSQFLNNFDEAIPLLNNSLKLYESDEEYSIRKLGQKYRGAGYLYREAEDFDLSELYYLKSIQYLQGQENTAYEIASAYNELGLMSKEMGEYEKAIRFYTMSYKMSPRVELNAYHNLAIIYQEQSINPDKAIYYANKVVAKAALQKDYRILASINNILGLVYHDQSNYIISRDYFTQALSFCDSLIQNNLHVRLKANLHENLAESFMTSYNFSMAKIEIQKAIQLMMPNNSSYTPNDVVTKNAFVRNISEVISMFALKADIISKEKNDLSNSNQLYESLHLYYKIDSLFHLNLSNISLNSSQLIATSRIIEYYEDAIEKNLHNYSLTKDVKYFTSAYYFSSQLKALLLENTLKMYSILEDEDEIELKKLESNLSNSIIDYDKNELSRDSLSLKIIQHQRDVYEFENRIRSKNSKVLNSFSNNKLDDISVIQSKLGSNEIILEYFEGENSIYCFLISKNSLNFNRIELNNENYDLLQAYSRACLDTNFKTIEEFKYLSRRLYIKLIGSLLGPDIDNIEKVIIIPDGIIHAVAFDALIGKTDDYLINEYNIVHSYSHKLYFVDRDVNDVEKRDKIQYIGFGPTYSNEVGENLVKAKILDDSSDLMSLNFSVSEIDESSDFYPKEKTFLNSKASKSSFLDIIHQADIAHLSMHSVVDYEVPDNSSLIFSDHHDDFVLKASEVAALNLNSELVILSSCKSATGLTTKGEGVQGLSRAFMLAGASSVLSSLWNASEFSSSKILPKFLEFHTKGESKAESLRKAKLSYLASVRPSLQHPFYWANYILLTHDESNYSSFSVSIPTALIFSGLAILLFCFFKTKF